MKKKNIIEFILLSACIIITMAGVVCLVIGGVKDWPILEATGAGLVVYGSFASLVKKYLLKEKEKEKEQEIK